MQLNVYQDTKVRFAGQKVSNFSGSTPGAETFMGNKPNFGKIAGQTMQNKSQERISKISSEAKVEAAKINAEAGIASAAANASATQTAGMFGGLSKGIGGGLNALKERNEVVDRGFYTNNPGAEISDPTASFKGLGKVYDYWDPNFGK